MVYSWVIAVVENATGPRRLAGARAGTLTDSSAYNPTVNPVITKQCNERAKSTVAPGHQSSSATRQKYLVAANFYISGTRGAGPIATRRTRDGPRSKDVTDD